MAPVVFGPTGAALEQAAAWLAAARRPVIVAQRGAGSPEGFAALARLADVWGIPVVQYWAVQLALATDHPMAAGSNPQPWLSEADVILVLDCLAPWSPAVHELASGCKVIQAGPDPLYSRFPVRNFPADLALAGETADILVGLERAMQRYRVEAVPARRDAVAAKASQIRAATLRAAAAGGAGEQMTKAWVSLCLSRAIEGRDATVLSELGCPFDPLTLRTAGSWYQEPHSGGLGWSMPCALGMQLAQPERLIIATMGDGSYMFANPVACHQIAEALGLPVLVLVLNNREWGAVRHSVVGVYPDGYAARMNQMPLVSLDPTPDFCVVAQASRAWTARVDVAAELPRVLEAAIAHVTTTRTQALVEIRVAS
jgi:acetolactate synthase-1/2/3 large subunit